MKKLIPILLLCASVSSLAKNGSAAPQSETPAPIPTVDWRLTPQFGAAFGARMARTLAGVVTDVDVRKGVLKIAVNYAVPIAASDIKAPKTRPETKVVEVALTRKTLLRKWVVSSVMNKASDKAAARASFTIKDEALQIAAIKVGQRASFSFVPSPETSAAGAPVSTNAEPPESVVAVALFAAPESPDSATKNEATPTK